MIVVGVLAGGFVAYYGVFNSADLMASVMAVGMGLFMAAGSIRMVYRASRLRMNEEGVSSGETRFKWREVTDAKWVAYGIHCCAGDRKIVIGPYAYHRPDDLIKFVEDALAKAK